MMDPCVDLEDELYFLRDEVDRLQAENEAIRRDTRTMRESFEGLHAEAERLTKGLWDKGEYVNQLNGVIRRQRIETERLRDEVKRLTSSDGSV